VETVQSDVVESELPIVTRDSTSAVRTRRYRERKRGGAVVVSIEIEPEHVRALIDRGYLKVEPDGEGTRRVRRQAIGLAILAMIEDRRAR